MELVTGTFFHLFYVLNFLIVGLLQYLDNFYSGNIKLYKKIDNSTLK